MAQISEVFENGQFKILAFVLQAVKTFSVFVTSILVHKNADALLLVLTRS